MGGGNTSQGTDPPTNSSSKPFDVSTLISSGQVSDSLGPSGSSPTTSGAQHLYGVGSTGAAGTGRNMLSLLLPGMANSGSNNVSGGSNSSTSPLSEKEFLERQILDSLKGMGSGGSVEPKKLPAGAKVFSEADILRMHGVDKTVSHSNSQQHQQSSQSHSQLQHQQLQSQPQSQQQQQQRLQEDFGGIPGMNNPMGDRGGVPLRDNQGDAEMKRIMSMLAKSVNVSYLIHF